MELSAETSVFHRSEIEIESPLLKRGRFRMTAHISNTQMEKFCARVLPAPETFAFAEHISDCATCQLLFHQTFQRRRNHAPVTIDMSPEVWFGDDHLEYEQMVGLVENTLDREEREMINVHLEICARCSEDLRKFREFVRQIKPAIYIDGENAP